LRAIFRLPAVSQKLREQETPPKRVINEYVDGGPRFFEGGDEPKFVNAVLRFTWPKKARPKHYDLVARLTGGKPAACGV